MHSFFEVNVTKTQYILPHLCQSSKNANVININKRLYREQVTITQNN